MRPLRLDPGGEGDNRDAWAVIPAALGQEIDAEQSASRLLLLTPTQKLRARAVIADYLRRCETNQALHNYTQARPYKGLGIAPEQRWDGDCSSYVALAFYWAKHVTGVPLVDPLGYAYAGWGYTGSIYMHNRRHPVPFDHVFMVGDLALYGNSFTATTHVTICRRKGDRNTSIWSSNGRQAAPEPVRLFYRRPLGVFRPESLL